MKFIKAGLCVASIVLFIITLALMSNDDAAAHGDGHKLNHVQAAYGLTGLCLGIVVAAGGAALAFLEDIGKIPAVKAGWASLALIALWFIGGAVGIWALINNETPTYMTAHWKADMSFFIISSILWLITIAYVVVDLFEGAGCDVMKIPALVLLGVTAVFCIITMALAAADRAGHGGSTSLGEVSHTYKTQSYWAAFSLTGSLVGFVFSLIGIALLLVGLWGKDELLSRVIRFVWVAFIGFAIWMLAAMCGIWSYYIAHRSSSQVGPGYDFKPYTAYFKAEFAFEIISSVLLIASAAFFAAWGAGGKGGDSN